MPHVVERAERFSMNIYININYQTHAIRTVLSACFASNLLMFILSASAIKLPLPVAESSLSVTKSPGKLKSSSCHHDPANTPLSLVQGQNRHSQGIPTLCVNFSSAQKDKA